VTGVCAVAGALVLAGCTSSSTTSPPSGGSAAGKVSGTLVVFAATSLTEAFDKIGAQFQKAHPGVTVKFNYNGSSSLATSITQGAPADVFASASPTNVKTFTDAGDAPERRRSSPATTSPPSSKHPTSWWPPATNPPRIHRPRQKTPVID